MRSALTARASPLTARDVSWAMAEPPSPTNTTATNGQPSAFMFISLFSVQLLSAAI
jgi:hypothetical protein